MIPRVFVGTLHSNEGELEHCKKAILEQNDVNVTHVIISGLPEKEAHNELWRSWREAKNDHDIFVKVDADTVLFTQTIIAQLWAIFDNNPRVTGVQAPLLDYFTDGYINGLNCFSPRVTFNDTVDGLFCDRGVDVNHDIVIRSTDVPPALKPAGWHCFHATPIQAFHYGLHRALKKQSSTLQLLKQAWERHRDEIRAYALIGASMASTSQGFCNYTDERFQQMFASVVNNFERLTRNIE